MPRETLDSAIERLQNEILTLGEMVRNSILEAVDSLKRRDFEASRRLIAQDQAINEKRFAIETDTLVVIATQQPMASDLRFLAAILEIVTELERIADYAKGIAKINLLIGDKPLIKPLIDIPRMAQKAADMLYRALEAFVQRDVEKAEAIPKEDDEMDALYDQVYRELMTYVISNPANLEQANYLLWAAHNLERAADRVTNICERVIFTVTGEMRELDLQEDIGTRWAQKEKGEL
ncbi:MAG: phosphate signaling complex protein PhoU [Anaerolineae bacterium]|nr:phosphate signaling complex protein PhoU [Anaerolineae bacterium]MDW8101668.1 phosphate signaling complex protein PhoU [Anaerolineae bacterium]